MAVQIAAVNDRQMRFSGMDIGDRIYRKNDKQQGNSDHMNGLADILSHKTITPGRNSHDRADLKLRKYKHDLAFRVK
jgi:hypothetical protein